MAMGDGDVLRQGAGELLARGSGFYSNIKRGHAEGKSVQRHVD
jgi:hypothetical protein